MLGDRLEGVVWQGDELVVGEQVRRLLLHDAQDFDGELANLGLRVPAAPHVIRYALRFTRLTRRDQGDVPDFVRDYVTWGAGPRASQYLVIGAKAHAVLQGRYYATIADVKAIAHPVLRHRIVTNFTAEAEGVTTDKIIDKLLEVIPAKEAEMEKNAALPKVTS